MSNDLEQLKRQYAGFICNPAIVEHIYKSGGNDLKLDSELNHLAYSLVHNGIEPPRGFGGCSCDVCNALRTRMMKIRHSEANE